jgi:hypothetical protein
MTSPSLFEKLLILSGESTVPVQLLSENEQLIALLRDESVSQEQALEFVNENY